MFTKCELIDSLIVYLHESSSDKETDDREICR